MQQQKEKISYESMDPEILCNGRWPGLCLLGCRSSLQAKVLFLVQ